MTKIALLLSFTAVLILTNATFSQSRFLKPGISGFGIGGGYSTNSNADGFGGALGYSVNGFFDVGVSFVLGASSYPIVYLSPTVGIAEDVTTFFINAGFVFPTGSKQRNPTPSRSDDELDALIFGQPGAQHLEIRSVSNNYLLVYSSPQTPLLTGKSNTPCRHRKSL